MALNQKTRIELNDTLHDIVLKLGEGHIGAISVLAKMSTQGDEIDPDDFLKGLGSVLFLDTLGIYGYKVWFLYKDICKESILNTIGILRAVQLGIFPADRLQKIISTEDAGGRINMPDGLLEELIAKVQARLPSFAKQDIV